MKWKLLGVLVGLIAAIVGTFTLRSGDDNAVSPRAVYALSSHLTETAFPADEAGLAVIGNVGPVAFERIFQAVSPLVELGGSDGASYIWGLGEVARISGRAEWSDAVGLYADVSGLVVAFFPRGDESARIASWQSRGIGLLPDNTLEQALQPVVVELGVPFDSLKASLEYSHFEYPDATEFILFAIYGEKRMTFLIPDGLNIYEASYNGIDNSTVSSGAKLGILLNQGTVVSGINGERRIGRFEEVVGPISVEFTQAGGKAAGEIFSVSLDLFPIFDTNGDAVVNGNDIALDTSGLTVDAVDAASGKIDLKVVQESPFDRAFTVGYMGRLVSGVDTGVLYELTSQRGERESGVAVVVVWGPQ